jgi:hypothetical protein
MKLDQKIIGRFQELIEEGEKVLTTRYSRSRPGIVYFGDNGVDSGMSHQWGTSALNFLSRVMGRDSDYYVRFNQIFGNFHDYTPVKTGLGILKAAKADYEHGYLLDTRMLIQAEIFDEFLEQAEHLLDAGYDGPSAVIAGCVLEDGLRKLCQSKGVLLPNKPKLDTMNSELAKAGVYNSLVQKRITSWADLRNKAAHGKWTEFTTSDVKQMIDEVRRFMETYMS